MRELMAEVGRRVAPEVETMTCGLSNLASSENQDRTHWIDDDLWEFVLGNHPGHHLDGLLTRQHPYSVSNCPLQSTYHPWRPSYSASSG